MKKIFIFMLIFLFIPKTNSEIHLGVLGAVKKRSEKLYNKVNDTIIYPDTDQPPQLTIKWWSTGSTIPKEDVYLISTFGVLKINMPGHVDHFTLWVASSAYKPIYSLCDGVVVSLEPGYDKDHQVIRYGKNYAVEYCHVVNLNSDLYIGKIVKKGDKIGEICPLMGQPGHNVPLKGTGYFEVRFLKRKENGKWIAVDLYEYLDPVSKENIKEIWLEKGLSETSTAGLRNIDGKLYDIFGNEITTSTIRGAVHEIDLPGYDYNDRIIYDYRRR
jgi:murein DD-endopeptidase MepM/ murein hydrolase activator NlpD